MHTILNKDIILFNSNVINFIYVMFMLRDKNKYIFNNLLK